MTHPALAMIGAVFLWWFSTGIIMLAVRRADHGGHRARRALVWGTLPILLVGIGIIGLSLQVVDVISVYLGFVGALVLWGWIELAFLAGVITGPVREDCPHGLAGWPRFQRAFGTLAWHELLLTLGLCGLVLLTSDAANRMALSTYLVLYLARIFAKLNLYFGVPRINTEFLPSPLAHLKSYFRQGTPTLAFPAAITALTALLVVCIERFWFAQAPATVVGFALLSALTALALLEHWLMVIPLPDAKLWRWMLPAPHAMTTEESKDHGF